MIQKNAKLILPILALSILFFGLDKLFFQFNFPTSEIHFIHSIATIFGFFIFCSCSIMILLLQVKQKNINSVGQTFLLTTTIKMGLSFLLAKPILNSVSEISKIEKFHFLAIFAIFLIFETVFTIRLLNNKSF